MRTCIMLLTAAVVLSACADDQHPTGPASRSAVTSRSAAGDAAPSGQLNVNAQAKPTDQVGFTKVFTVTGAPILVGPSPNSAIGSATATCPAGSQAIGGSYSVGPDFVAPYVTITSFGLNGANGWTVVVWHNNPAFPTAKVIPVAICVQ